ncbi:Glycosyl transferase family 2 [Butyrivibrio sp. INlla18]|uniref:glycosyltransferase family 2 protein n=1 Tax=Butyrivibrio sp. INlla18 TaxID=1520806 RepID=UPI000882F62F|nr:glycosyltransferase [Butyrivibrio sp. INlla18]SDA69972.1 Glycosyl transferase family 2 [Butyrivibrio sp. INlla18]
MILTIGIPVHNAEKYISRCLESIIQSDGFEDYEIICIDDGSTDGSLEILREYERQYDNIRVISSLNQGAFLARALIIENAHGEWVGFVDADDTIERAMYSTMLAKANGSSVVDMVVCAFNKVDDMGNVIGDVQMNFMKQDYLDFVKNPKERGQLIAVNPAYWNKIFRLKKIEQRIKLQESPRVMEDAIFFASVIPNIDGVAFVQTAEYNYHDVAGSVTKKIGSKELEEAKLAVIKLKKYFEEQDVITNKYCWDVIALLAYIHVGLAFSINYNDYRAGENAKTVYENTLLFLKEEFSALGENSYLSLDYVVKRKCLVKAYVACKLYQTPVWPYAVYGYRLLSRLLKKDLKW